MDTYHRLALRQSTPDLLQRQATQLEYGALLGAFEVAPLDLLDLLLDQSWPSTLLKEPVS